MTFFQVLCLLYAPVPFVLAVLAAERGEWLRAGFEAAAFLGLLLFAFGGAA